MAVREADKALDDWLTSMINHAELRVEASDAELRTNKSVEAFNIHGFRSGSLWAFQETQKQLREFWGASLIP